MCVLPLPFAAVPHTCSPVTPALPPTPGPARALAQDVYNGFCRNTTDGIRFDTTDFLDLLQHRKAERGLPFNVQLDAYGSLAHAFFAFDGGIETWAQRGDVNLVLYDTTVCVRACVRACALRHAHVCAAA